MIVLILIFVYDNPLEKKKNLARATANNSQEYINALATILQNAQSREFIIKTIGEVEQLKLQKKLGLKVGKQDRESLVQAWTQQTKKTPIMLEKLLKMSTKKPSLNDIKLLEWMKQWKTIHQEINFQSSDYDNKQ